CWMMLADLACRLEGALPLRALLDALLPHAGLHSSSGRPILYVGPVSHRIAMLWRKLGDPEQACIAFERAARGSQEVGSVTWTAWAHYEWASEIERSGGTRQRALAA